MRTRLFLTALTLAACDAVEDPAPSFNLRIRDRAITSSAFEAFFYHPKNSDDTVVRLQHGVDQPDGGGDGVLLRRSEPLGRSLYCVPGTRVDCGRRPQVNATFFSGNVAGYLVPPTEGGEMAITRVTDTHLIGSFSFHITSGNFVAIYSARPYPYGP
jgi:hypothetical protein